MTFTITKKFKTSVERTDRVLEVAEGFGLGLSEKDFTLYDDVEIDARPGDVIYITGQSGSGKSVLLRELSRLMAESGEWGQVANIDDVGLEEKPLIDQIGGSTNEAINLLSLAGINDAYLLLRKPSELSDGQRYRLRLAKLLERDVDVLVADEFGAVLDRTTAKVIAFNMQKAARRYGKTLIVATTHTDLEEELGASLVIHKRFRDRVDIRENRDEATTPAVEPDALMDAAQAMLGAIRNNDFVSDEQIDEWERLLAFPIAPATEIKTTAEVIADQVPDDDAGISDDELGELEDMLKGDA